MSLNRPPILSALAIVILFLSIQASAEWKEQVLYSFQGGSDGQVPAGGVVFDKQGNLYGATETGTVFQLAPPTRNGDPWTETVLYTFKGKNDNNDGMQPSGGLVIDGSGNLYGTTAYGGTGGCILLGALYGCGTVYELSPPQQKGGQWTETILYSFQSGNDGYFPNGDLTFDSGGKLYGATSFGGGKGNTCNPYYGGNCGTVFQMSPPKQMGAQWTEQVLHSFAGRTDGGNPNGGLVLDNRATIYGTAQVGGYNCPHNSGEGCGMVFKLSPPKRKRGGWVENILYSFKGGTRDSRAPNGKLVFDREGRLYGTTMGGAGSADDGSVFELAPPTRRNLPWREILLQTFVSEGDPNGANPRGGLTFDSAGGLYGTASAAGVHFGGTFFRLNPLSVEGAGWSFALLYTFGGPSDAASPVGEVVFDTLGNVYGATQNGGTGNACQGGCGTVFEVSP